MVTKLEQLIELAKGKSKKIISVAAAHDEVVLKAVMEAVKLNIVDAILVGDKQKIEDICIKNKYSSNDIQIIDEKEPLKAARKSVELVSSGKAQFIMKGMVSTAVLLKAVLNKEANLRGNGVLSHVMIYEVPSYTKLLFLTDGGMIPYPDLIQKINILKNAVKVVHSLGIENPKVAPLCAVEVINPSMQATIDAAALTKMNQRGQIKGCIVDGPLALDNAVSKESAKHKGIVSDVAGDADILLVPNIEAGNLLGKSMTYFANAENAGIVVGAKCPVVLVSRSDSAKSKLYSIALGALAIN